MAESEAVQITSEGKWILVDSGEIVYVNELGQQRWPESALYKKLPEGVSARDVRRAGGELTSADVQKVENASQAAKDLAAERGISLLDVEATGKEGIIKEDVEAFVQETGEGMSDEERAQKEQDDLIAQAEAEREDQEQFRGQQVDYDEDEDFDDEEFTEEEHEALKSIDPETQESVEEDIEEGGDEEDTE